MPDQIVLIGSGIVIGLVTAAPIGGVNLICIRRTLSSGPLNGFLAGLGAATGDGLFALLATYGHSAIADLFVRSEHTLQYLGAAFLLALGIYTYFADPARAEERRRPRWSMRMTDDLPHTMVATFLLTITNPATLIGFTAIFASLGDRLGLTPDVSHSGLVTAAVFAGSAMWWLILAVVVELFHGQIGEHWLARVNHITGAVITILGVGVLVAALT
jgi:threonine/homoserine/homoserine lactone efflux protein